MNPTQASAALLKAANKYTHNPTPQAVLDPFKEAILTLRAKYASYEIVTEMLNKHEVQVSIATVRRFCRRHHGEMRLIRAEILAQKNPSPTPGETTPDTLPGDTSSLSKKSRRLRGSV